MSLSCTSSPTRRKPLSLNPTPKARCHAGQVRSCVSPIGLSLLFPDVGASYELLARDLSRKMEAMSGRLAPGTGNIARRLRVPTEEFIYVLSGSLIVALGAEKHHLHAGDSIYFEGYDLTELLCGSEDEDAVWISVITPPAF